MMTAAQTTAPHTSSPAAVPETQRTEARLRRCGHRLPPMRLRAVLITTVVLVLIATGIALAAPSSVSPPQITGKPDYGQVLRCDPGTWSGNPVTLSYTWTSGEDVGGLQVGTEQTLVVPDAIGYGLSCTVTATDASGATATATSAGVMVAAGLTTVKIKQVRIGRDRITISGQVGPPASTRADGAKGHVALGIKQKDTFLELSDVAGYVKPNGDFTISATTYGRARYAILYYPSSSLYQQITVQTRSLLVPK